MTPSPESAADIRAGQVLAGKYRVERILGTGGMGVVVAAHHIQLDERVALKFLLPSAVTNMESVARFMREARAAFKIKSEHVARVTDVGQLENGSPYIVMEYLEGKDLAAWLSQYGPMPIEQAVDFVLQACEALAEAHVLGIVHRDLKPANLFCVQRSDGQLSIKVLDFGISKLTSPGAQAHAMTRTNSLAGSPQYMSPEHMKSSKSVDARTDLWSLGVILFELIAGRPPFEAESATELVLKVASDPPTKLRALRPDAPASLEEVLSRCLEKDRDRRYQTVAELAIALRDFAPPHARASIDRVVGTLQRAGVTGSVAPSPTESSTGFRAAVPLQPSQPLTVASWGEAKPRGKTGGLAMVAIAVGVALSLVALLTFLFWPKSPPQAANEGSWPAAGGSPSSSGTPGAMGDLARPVATASPPATSPSSAAVPAPPPTGPSMETAPLPAASAHAPRPAAPVVRDPCNPPYYFDHNGTQHFKKECVR